MKPERAPHKQWNELGKRIPIRTCVVCRSKFAQSLVLRLGKDSAGGLQLDAKRRLTGRGVYVCNNSQCHTPKALMRLSRADAPRLALELEAYFSHVNLSPSQTVLVSLADPRESYEKLIFAPSE